MRVTREQVEKLMLGAWEQGITEGIRIGEQRAIAASTATEESNRQKRSARNDAEDIITAKLDEAEKPKKK